MADDNEIIEQLKSTLDVKPKRMKVKTLIKKFGFVRRTEENMLRLTELFRDHEILVNPTIMKLGDTWRLDLEDWIYLSLDTPQPQLPESTAEMQVIEWDGNQWLDLENLADKQLRTEKEVEMKFIIPLLFKLGFNETDRYDDMAINAATGSKPTVLHIDFALFNSELESLKNQVLLTVEAKRENRLTTQKEIIQARNQAKSYALWTGCSFCLITDGNIIEVFSLPRTHLEKETILFNCSRIELASKFSELYKIISKSVLTQFYTSQFGTVEEIT
ncbi:type I restriction enzyme HsdR N-terminal domain-containing protein [Beggiatoa leptomitoformis]|uniref:Restriction endonuclease subunit R n=1 Tax=Beggiatoa leptomitoformis TaxID=288004 RepID=A0A2N9YH72_9GAMM|nr:type I restriction enzyme HsdR N-terminal domain-containing protein [Beggiatoa leptomitoformis]ALG67886.1 restriction endonuclease subunit R [Beggiatoa leptomitoformis]AUI69850.1 restriction endonuclease subunit R [Beggiatoa leptomitoformis]